MSPDGSAPPGSVGRNAFGQPMRRKEDELRFLGGIELGLKHGKIALPRGVIQGQKLQLLLRRLLLKQLDIVRGGGDPAGVSFDAGAPPVVFTAGNFVE